jgi:hypothetical protein
MSRIIKSSLFATDCAAQVFQDSNQNGELMCHP